MSSKTIEVYEILKRRFSEEEAKALIEYFETLPEMVLATKEDLYKLRDELRIEIANLGEELKREIKSL